MANEKKKKAKKSLSKREIVFICVIILETLLILFDIIPFLKTANSKLNLDLFTLITAVVCSILAAALTPKVISDNNSGLVEKLDNYAASISERDDRLSEQISKFFGNVSNDNSQLIGKIKYNVDQQIKDFLNTQQCVLPTVTYFDTNDPNIEFNKKMNASVSTTQHYIYFSDRALYMTKRLGKDINTFNPRLKITVFLADIRVDEIFYSRKDVYLKRERAKHDKTKDYVIRNIDQIVCQEKKEVLRSLYALNELKSRYDIEIYLHKEIPFIRFEITDSLLVMSFLPQLSTGKKYPSTLIYENEAVFKPNFEDFANEIRIRSQHLNDLDLTLDSLLLLARDAHLDDITEYEIREYYETRVK